MEKQLFNWLAMDVMDTMAFQFYDCTLVQRIGLYSRGTRFATITMDYEKGTIQLWKGDESIYTGQLELIAKDQ